MHRVAVLMSTYNGEKYLEEQIDSILAQKNVKVDLIIRDDGSSDNTLKIIRHYADKYDNVKFIDDNEHYGPSHSFMELLYNTDGYEYYSFADQDDVWKPQKINTAIQMLKGEKNVPCLYFSNQTIFMNDSERGLRFNKEPSHSLSVVLYYNIPSGCTMILNSALRNECAKDSKIPNKFIKLRMHDVWVHVIALLKGKVIYDSRSFINYRIHNSNTVGVPDAKGFIFTFIYLCKRIKRYFVGMTTPSEENSPNSSMMTARILIASVKNIRENDKELLLKYVNYRRSFRDKAALIFARRTWRESSLRLWCEFVVKVLLNWM